MGDGHDLFHDILLSTVRKLAKKCGDDDEIQNDLKRAESALAAANNQRQRQDEFIMKKVTGKLREFEQNFNKKIVCQNGENRYKIMFFRQNFVQISILLHAKFQKKCFRFEQGFDKKVASRSGSFSGKFDADAESLQESVETLKHQLAKVQANTGEGLRQEIAQVRRVVVSCEKDMEQFTSALDIVNQDLDETRARIDSVAKRKEGTTPAAPVEQKFQI